MKTNYSLRRIPFYTMIGFALTAVSCGSYQNTSSYDNDGIYGSVPHDANNNAVYTYNDGNVTQYRDGAVTGQNMQYKQYFGQLQGEYPGTAYTDAEDYSSYENPSDTIQDPGYATGYAGWGEDPDNVTVNVYGNNGYGGYGYGGYGYGGYGYGGYGYGGYGYGGYGLGLGWGYGGWSLGLGWGYGGWGYPYYGYGYGWGYPYYGGYYGSYYNNYVYQGGRRGAYASNTRGYANSRYSTSPGRSATSYNTNRRGSMSSPTRFNSGTVVRSRGNTDYNTSAVRNSQSTYQNSSRSYAPSRNSSYNSAPSRSYSPAPSRSSGGSFGGGRSGGGGFGGGGGSRGGGGGGGRRG